MPQNAWGALSIAGTGGSVEKRSFGDDALQPLRTKTGHFARLLLKHGRPRAVAPVAYC